MRRLVLAVGLSALLAAPATAATLFEATASVAISQLDVQGLTATYTGTVALGAATSGVFGTAASAFETGDSFATPNVPTPIPSAGLTVGSNVSGVTPSNPAADSTATAFCERSVTLSFANTTSSGGRATFTTAFSWFAKAVSDGLAGETALARAIVTVARNGVTESITTISGQRLLGETGTQETPLNQAGQWNITVLPFTTETITCTLRAEGNSAVSAVD
ncbi:MAG: hypothetical protein MUF73_18285, partial [Rhodobacteraceae bacterium]|nr:hypothetical protein [Paracoccaceae bacterium]